VRLAVTGHRPPKIGGYNQPNIVSTAIRQGMHVALTTMRPEIVYIGMALGSDQMMAEVCIQLGIPFFACIPFLGFESRWPPHSQRRYNELLRYAADQIVVTPVRQYRAWYMQARNQWMVDRADRLLAVWNGVRDGGTWNCIRYAESVSKPWSQLAVAPGTWEEARRIEALESGNSAAVAEMAALAAASAQAAALPASPTIPVVPEAPPQLSSFALRLIRRRNRGPALPNPGITPLTVERADQILEGRDDIADEIIRSLGIPAAFLTGERSVVVPHLGPIPVEEGSPPTSAKKEEVRDRFKPGRVLELDDD
jgi:uncharacterized phage-like protein YoqJ